MKKIAAIAAAITMGAALTGCTNDAKTYTDYIKATLDCTYFGETAEYMKLTESTQEEADEVYASQIEYTASVLCYYLDVNMDYVTEETMDGYEETAEALLSKMKYEVEPAEKSGDSYHITIKCEPINCWEAIGEDVDEFYTGEFGDRYNEVVNGTSEEDLAALEEEYAVEVLEIINTNLTDLSYKEPVTKIVEIVEDEDGFYGISDEDWYDIDDILMDLD